MLLWAPTRCNQLHVRDLIKLKRLRHHYFICLHFVPVYFSTVLSHSSRRRCFHPYSQKQIICHYDGRKFFGSNPSVHGSASAGRSPTRCPRSGLIDRASTTTGSHCRVWKLFPTLRVRAPAASSLQWKFRGSITWWRGRWHRRLTRFHPSWRPGTWPCLREILGCALVLLAQSPTGGYWHLHLLSLRYYSGGGLQVWLF